MEKLYMIATDTPLGAMGLVASGERLILAQFLNGEPTELALEKLSSTLGENVFLSKNGILVKAVQQLELYFKGAIRRFSLPLKPVGTSFQERVWKELLRISYGATKSYGEIARRIDNPYAARAVGGACNANQLAIFIPCHRVIGIGGNPKGYSGGLENKLKLLEHEGRILSKLKKRRASRLPSQSQPLPYRPVS